MHGLWWGGGVNAYVIRVGILSWYSLFRRLPFQDLT
jgi:hypothetical protein